MSGFLLRFSVGVVLKSRHLWSSGQIGEQTPSVLLRSLLYLNTKYFGLRTSEQHLRLAFGNVYGPSSSKPHSHETTVCIRIPSISQEQHGAFIWSIIQLFISVAIILQPIFVVMPLCIVIHSVSAVCLGQFCRFPNRSATRPGVIFKFSVFVRSAGCKLLFKQDFASRLGLKCVTCNHCTQMCKKSLTKQIDEVSRDFCSETCAKMFHDCYYKVHWSSCLIWSFITLGSCDQALVVVLLLRRPLTKMTSSRLRYIC